MLFNSNAFIFLFLPVTLAGFFLLARVTPMLAAGWLTARSEEHTSELQSH